MAAPAGAFQRAVLVAVPLALIVVIFVTPALFGGEEQPQPTDVPFLLVEFTAAEWNGTVNETALLYVQSALGAPLYENITISVSGIDNGTDLGATCGGIGAFVGGNWTCTGILVPSLSLKLPAIHEEAVNVTAVAVREDATFAYNATVAFVWDQDEWVLHVWPGGDVDQPPARPGPRFSWRLEARP